MSEHRRKMPQPPGDGRAASRRAAQQPSGRRAAPSRETTVSHAEGYEEEPVYGGRAEARRAAQRGGRRRGADGGGAGPGGGGGGRRGGGGDDGHGEPRKKRFIDYPRYNKYGWRRWVPSWKQTTGLSIAFVGSVLAAGTIAYAMVEVPDEQKASLAQKNVYYWDDNTQMASADGAINRQIIDISEIPRAMQNAVVSAENKSFYDDPGVDFMGMGRAVFNMAMGGDTQGGSTITQQYVKNARLGDQSQTFSRKFKELFIAMRVGTDMDKDKIMQGYLNTSYYGRGAWGIQAASRTYYGKDAKDLNASECAFLASLLKGATLYDPAGATELNPNATPEGNTRRAKIRWESILNGMVKDKRLDASERARYTEFPMPDPPKKSDELGGQVGYLVDLAKANFINNNDRGITADDLNAGGYEIHTTFNKKRVDMLEKSVKKIYDANIDPKKRPDKDTHVQFGGASVEPSSGKIIAIYGGEDATKHFTNNADQTGAQVGSTFKPFVLAAAMEHGKRDPGLSEQQTDEQRTPVSPDKAIYNGDNKLKIKNYDGSIWTNEEDKEWLQTNDGGENFGDINLRKAMKRSANSPFVQLGMDVGIDQVRQAAINAGLRPDSLSKSNVPSFSLGISDPSAIRMAGSYATFAASGKQRDPYSVDRVLKEGKVIYQHKATATNAFPSNVADNVTDVLKEVVKDGGTGSSAQLPGREVAGKTGTTDGNKSAWFVGYTPQLSTAIDMYRMDDDAKNTKRQFEKMFGTGGQAKIHGASFPADIWQDYMAQALKGKPIEKFPKPEPIGEAVYGGGAASPTPTPSDSPSASLSDSPSPTVSESESKETPSQTPSSSGETCNNIFGCANQGNSNQGNGNQGNGNGGPGGGGGDDETTSPTPTSEESDDGGGGGIFG
ncbi:transglycosylase domain-containing protein [Streptomyces sp. NPDC059092]|uniref:transglycosylase domain-containing protein n=1 Tax=Streptomyces sp. NPDC059092 TaxID=3346725 RepID=UPI0036A5EE76